VARLLLLLMLPLQRLLQHLLLCAVPLAALLIFMKKGVLLLSSCACTCKGNEIKD